MHPALQWRSGRLSSSTWSTSYTVDKLSQEADEFKSSAEKTSSAKYKKGLVHLLNHLLPLLVISSSISLCFAKSWSMLSSIEWFPVICNYTLSICNYTLSDDEDDPQSDEQPSRINLLYLMKDVLSNFNFQWIQWIQGIRQITETWISVN